MALWAAAAGLVVVAVGLVIAIRRGGAGDDASLVRLPIGANGETAAADAARPGTAEDMSFAAAPVYVPGEGLPALGGEAPAFRLAGETTAADVGRLADALGIEGEPRQDGDTWHVEGNDLVLDVYGIDGTWSAYHTFAGGDTPVSSGDASAGSSGDAGTGSSSAGAGAGAVCRELPAADPDAPPVSECLVPGEPQPAPMPEPVEPGVPEPEPMPEPVEPDVPKPTEPGVPEPAPMPVEPEPIPVEPAEPPVRPADLPSEDEAEQIALDLLAATGTDVEGAAVQVADGVTEWSVSVEPVLGGLPAPGLSMYVGVGSEGHVTSASGTLAEPEELGDYPLIATGAALQRLNEQVTLTTQIGPIPDAADAAEPQEEPAPDSGSGVARDPGEDLPVLDTAPLPAPSEVAVTDAEIVLLAEVAWDGSGTYLVPGYRFTAEDGSDPVVTAVADDLLEAPPSDPDTTAPVPPETGIVPGDPGTEPGGAGSGDDPPATEPAPAVDLPAEPGSDPVQSPPTTTAG